MRLGVNTLFLIPGEVGGTETYLRQTLLALAADTDIQLVLFTNTENDAVLRSDLSGVESAEFHLLKLKARNRYSRIIREQLELPGRVRKAGVDILWSPGYTAPVISPVPQLVTVHDMQYKRFPQDLTPLARVVTDVLVRAACRRCDAVIAVSQSTKSEICHFTATRPDKIFVTLEGVNPVFGEAPGERSRLDCLLPPGEPYILSVAHSYPHKNIPALIDAFRLLVNDVPHRLVLVGNMRLGERAVQTSLAGVPADRVTRLSSVSFDQIVSLYQHADVFVLPSLYEGFGLPVLEAMSAGTPVVTTRHASLSEVGGEHAFFTDPVTPEVIADAIRSVISMSPSERRARTAAAREWASRFRWSETAERTKQAFRCVLDAGWHRPKNA